MKTKPGIEALAEALQGLLDSLPSTGLNNPDATLESVAKRLMAAKRNAVAVLAEHRQSGAEEEDLLSFMDRGVLRMPYALAMGMPMSRRQFYDRVQSLLDRIEGPNRAIAGGP